MNEVVIVSAVRTPIGSFNGSLAGVSATKLGAVAIKAAVERAGIQPDQVQEVFMGNVVSANLGQAPATQAAIYAGLPTNVPSTTVNKVCASGMKAAMLGAQSIMLGLNDIVVAGGMESMSNIPYYLEKARFGYKLGHGQLIDGMIRDGLWDVYKDYHMGNAAELCAREYKITREQQDEYAINSYKRAEAAVAAGRFKNEIAPVSIPQRKGEPIVVSEDEEYKNIKYDKVAGLSPVFEKDGTVTAANASTLNDGASAMILMSAKKAQELGIKPLAVIRGFGDAQQAPEWFTTSPAKAVAVALKNAGISLNQIDYFETNEAFSLVALVNNQLLGLDSSRVNVNGGAVSLGHPLGSSGSRIMTTLVNVLEQNNGKYGVASICNGGGGASAIVIEKL
ncbi:MAG: acetyl-CoA C-acyltransferase [Flavobacteriales bacterium]